MHMHACTCMYYNAIMPYYDWSWIPLGSQLVYIRISMIIFNVVLHNDFVHAIGYHSQSLISKCLKI